MILFFVFIRIRINGVFVQNSETLQTSNKFEFILCTHFFGDFFLSRSEKIPKRERRREMDELSGFGWMCLFIQIFTDSNEHFPNIRKISSYLVFPNRKNVYTNATHVLGCEQLSFSAYLFQCSVPSPFLFHLSTHAHTHQHTSSWMVSFSQNFYEYCPRLVKH